MDTYAHYIDGTWTPGSNQATFDVRNPYDDSLYARAANGTATEANLAVTATAAGAGTASTPGKTSPTRSG